MDGEAEFLKAFEELSDALYRHCYFRVLDAEKARDLVQEAFTRTWDYLVRGGTITHFRPFLYRTVQNLIIDSARKKNPLSIETLPPADLGALSYREDASLAMHLDAERVIAAVKELAEPYRGAVLLRYVDGFSPKEIADLLGTSENVVSVRIHRGLATVKQRLAYAKR